MANRSGSWEGSTADSVSQVKDTMSDVARTAADKIDEGRTTAAEQIDTAASTLRENAETLPGGERVSEFAHAAADRLRTTADYVRRNDVNRMMADVETLVKNNPGPSLLVAAAVGFVVGRALARD